MSWSALADYAGTKAPILQKKRVKYTGRRKKPLRGRNLPCRADGKSIKAPPHVTAKKDCFDMLMAAILSQYHKGTVTIAKACFSASGGLARGLKVILTTFK